MCDVDPTRTRLDAATVSISILHPAAWRLYSARVSGWQTLRARFYFDFEKFDDKRRLENAIPSVAVEFPNLLSYARYRTKCVRTHFATEKEKNVYESAFKS